MDVIGLGNGGNRIADLFSSYEQYTVYKIGVNLPASERSISLPELKSPELYEEKCPDLKLFFKDLEDEVLFVLVGSSDITGATLAILEQIRHTRITILYVRPDLNLISHKKLLQEKITFNILQEYARSGLFHKLYLVDNLSMEEIIGEAPIAVYHQKINQAIVSTIHMINVFKHIEPVTITNPQTLDINKITTFGTLDPKTGKESLFYNLNNITNKFFYYSMSKIQLEKDGKLLQKIKIQVKDRLAENVTGGFGIYQNEYTDNYTYMEVSTHILQNVDLSA